jgi:hypothetical protein
MDLLFEWKSAERASSTQNFFNEFFFLSSSLKVLLKIFEFHFNSLVNLKCSVSGCDFSSLEVILIFLDVATVGGVHLWRKIFQRSSSSPFSSPNANFRPVIARRFE